MDRDRLEHVSLSISIFVSILVSTFVSTFVSHSLVLALEDFLEKIKRLVEREGTTVSAPIVPTHVHWRLSQQRIQESFSGEDRVRVFLWGLWLTLHLGETAFPPLPL